jgi:hypothetical protein
MRRLLYGGLVVFSGMVASPVFAPQPKETKADYKADPRFRILKRFFTKTDCPARHYAQVFIEAADRYDLDWRLLPSLSFIESTGGKAARNNNLFGWDGGKAQFPTPTASIHTVGYRLANSSLYKDKDLDGLLNTYNPDTEYAERVKSVMRQLAPK